MAFVVYLPSSSSHFKKIHSASTFVSPRIGHQRISLNSLHASEPVTHAHSRSGFRMQVSPDTDEAKEDPVNVCESCGREGGVVSGCDGNGKIVGGLGAVLDWWPIKAYRPCPDYLKANKTYRRAGQSLEEIAFGRKAAGDDKSISERLRGE